MSGRQTAEYLLQYARSFAVPALEHARVLSVAQSGEGYRVATTRGDFSARAVVIATGQCDVPRAPSGSQALASNVLQLTPNRYKRPDEIPDGGVLVVGAGATGVQLARELQRSGRQVTLAVGRHTRMPRRYRGHDIMWWLDRMGTLDRRFDEVADIRAARCEPSLQLVGGMDARDIDLGVLADEGVRLTGSFAGADAQCLHFADDLQQHVQHADERLERLLGRIDRFARRAEVAVTGPPKPVRKLTPAPATRCLDTRAERIRTVVWATGFSRDYSWLKVPAWDASGELRHRGGVLNTPGLYALGLSFLRRRNSSFIDGVGADAEYVAGHLHAFLSGPKSAAA